MAPSSVVGDEEHDVKIKLMSLLVDDQEKALAFYTEVLGFVKKHDMPLGEYRWLTVVSPPEDTELLLEPNAHPAAKQYQRALFDEGIPLAAFAVEDVQQEYERLTARGVAFTIAPMAAGLATIAVFDDTCGNRIQIFHA